MTTAVQTPPPQAGLLTAEEFVRQFSHVHAELVRGRVVELPMPGAKHGFVAFRVALLLGTYLSRTDAGRVFSNDTTVVTERGPDTGRGADVCFVSYAKIPKDAEVPDGPLTIPPDVVFEVRPPSDRWTEIFAKISEYLRVGVPVVVVLDPRTETASVYRPDDLQLIFRSDETLTLPDALPGFAAPVRDFFR